jgi:hypothetical protein
MKIKSTIGVLSFVLLALTNYIQAEPVPVLAYKLSDFTPKLSWRTGTVTPVNKEQLSCYSERSLILNMLPVGSEFKGQMIDTNGNIIQKGTTIVEIDKTRFKNELKIAQETLSAKEALVKQKEAELTRSKTLMGKNATSRQKYEEAVANYKTATADYISAKSELASAEIALAHCEIKAPFNGIVTKHLWSPGATRGDGDEVVEVMNVDYFLVSLEDVDSNINKFLDDSMTYKVFSRHSAKCTYAFNPKFNMDGKVFLIVKNSRVPRVFPLKNQESLPKIREIMGLTNKAGKLWAPMKSINKDEKGTFLYTCNEHNTNTNHEWTLNKVYIEINKNLISSSVIADFVPITKGAEKLNIDTTMVLCDINPSFKDGTVVFLQPLSFKFFPDEKVMINIPEAVNTKNCFYIPQSSLNTETNSLFKIIDGKAKKVNVEIIRSLGTYYEVKSNELKADEFIAVPKGKGLENGSEIMNIRDWNNYKK